MDFEVLILGSDINAYYMARCYNEEYNKKAYMIGKISMNFTKLSKIINLSIEPNLQDEKEFKRILKEFALKHKDKKILLIPSSDPYVRLIIENSEYLSKYFIFHKYSIELLNNLIEKENFYKNFKGVYIPETYIYNILNDLDFNKIKDIKYPLILKPSDVIMYHKYEFEGQHKVYKIKNESHLLSVIEDIKNSGYTGNLIIQKYIKGDDSHLFDCVAYCDRFGKVKLMTFAQIALQEHTPTGIGNATVVLNGYNEYGNTLETVEKLKKAIEKVNYHGFCEFDLKYDIDDKKFKVLEINPRQARCSYYLTFAGFNLVKYLVDDLIYEKELDYHFIDKKVCLSFVPKKVIKEQVNNKKLKNEVLKLYKEKLVVNPLKNKKDNSFKRWIWLKLRDINYIKKYRKNSW